MKKRVYTQFDREEWMSDKSVPLSVLDKSGNEYPCNVVSTTFGVGRKIAVMYNIDGLDYLRSFDDVGNCEKGDKLLVMVSEVEVEDPEASPAPTEEPISPKKTVFLNVFTVNGWSSPAIDINHVFKTVEEAKAFGARCHNYSMTIEVVEQSKK